MIQRITFATEFCLVALLTVLGHGHAMAQVPVEATFVQRGPELADTVIIFAQGGPFPDLRPDLVGTLPGMDNRLQVTVHQPWTLDAGILADHRVVTSEVAADLTRQAVDGLDRVVRHFVARGSAVCVVGHSYGALLTLAWLAEYDRPVGVQILAGRLSMPADVWQNFRDGRLWWFPDGRTAEPVGGDAPLSRIVPMRLQAVVGAKRYADLLHDRDLSHLTFVYGDRDRLVGALTAAELRFLDERGAHVIGLKGGDHRDMFDVSHADVVAPAFQCRTG